MNNSRLVIGISGKMGAGKDYVASWIKQLITPEIKLLAFGAHLKRCCYASNVALDYDSLHASKTTESRLLLQNTGTQIRINEHKDYFIRALDYDIKDSSTQIVIITDVRYLNEVHYVLNQPTHLMLRIEAPERNKQRLLREAEGDQAVLQKLMAHESETQLDSYPFEHIIKNDFHDNLGEQLTDLVVGWIANSFASVVQ